MRPSHLISAALLALALVGCGGPALRVESLSRSDKGRVYFRPTLDANGQQLQIASTPETYIGDLPTDWEIPEDLRGGKANVRIVYWDDTTKDVYGLTLLKDRDTVTRVAKAPIPR